MQKHTYHSDYNASKKVQRYLLKFAITFISSLRGELYSLYPRMLCVKFSSSWPIGYMEKKVKMKNNANTINEQIGSDELKWQRTGCVFQDELKNIHL